MGLTAGQLALNAGILRSGMQFGAGVSGFMQSRTNASILERRGKQAEQARMMEGRRLAGAQRARQAKSGIDPNVGTPAEVSRQTLEQARIAALRDRFAFEGEALFQKNRGNIALLGGALGATSTLLGASAREKELDDPQKIRIVGEKQLPATSPGFDPLFDPMTGERLA